MQSEQVIKEDVMAKEVLRIENLKQHFVSGKGL
ncbi:ABC transporter ATP-binding protein, partial [Vibrio sp. 1078-1]|nr:ABC transporter ATP-binding protein [Vibrio sp. 1078-1]